MADACQAEQIQSDPRLLQSIGRKKSSTAMSRTIREELRHFLDRGSCAEVAPDGRSSWEMRTIRGSSATKPATSCGLIRSTSRSWLAFANGGKQAGVRFGALISKISGGGGWSIITRRRPSIFGLADRLRLVVRPVLWGPAPPQTASLCVRIHGNGLLDSRPNLCWASSARSRVA